MYMPTLARFTARDPMPPAGQPVLLGRVPKMTRASMSAAMYPYEYVDNNPIRFVDPSGLQIEVPPVPEPPDFPGPGKDTGTKLNCKMLLGINICLCEPTTKAKRLSPIPGLGAPAGPPPQTGGGEHTWYGWPSDNLIGTGGCNECIGVIIKCPDGVAVYHFTAGDDAGCSLGIHFGGPGINWQQCHAIICGGLDTRISNCLADYVIAAVKASGAKLDGISGASACGVNPDGTWYDNTKPAGGGRPPDPSKPMS